MIKKLLLVVLFLLLGGSASFAQDAYYSETIVAPNPWVRQGGLLPAANTAVRVCSYSASPSLPCSPLATVWDTAGNIISTAQYGNFGQVSTDILGRLTFGCAAGKYTLQIQSTTNNTVIVNKPISCGGAGGSGIADPGNNGVMKRTAFNVSASAAYPDIVALWAGCVGFLKNDGTCALVGTGLGDPGVNGVVLRTGLNVTTIAAFSNIVNLWASGACTGFLKSDGTCVAIIPIANGGTGTSTPGLVAGTNVTITGSWPNQTINSTGGGGSGTVTVVGAGSLTSTAFMTGGGTTTSQTPSATSTLDSSGNAAFAGTIASGVGASTAGFMGLKQGTAQATVTNNVGFTAPTSVTAYNIVLPSAAASGVPTWSNSSNIVTVSITPTLGSGTKFPTTSITAPGVSKCAEWASDGTLQIAGNNAACGSGGSGYSTLQNNGSALTTRTTLNITQGLVAADDATNTRTNVKLPTMTDYVSNSAQTYIRDLMIAQTGISSTDFVSESNHYILAQLNGTNTLNPPGNAGLPNPSVGKLGIWGLITGTTSGNDVGLYVNYYAGIFPPPSATIFDYQTRFTLREVTNNYFAVGMVPQAQSTGTFAAPQWGSIYCDVTNTASAGTWACHNVNNSGTATNITCVGGIFTADTSAHIWRFTVTSSALHIYLDGTECATGSTTNLPTGNLTPGWEVKTNTTAAKGLYLHGWTFVQ